VVAYLALIEIVKRLFNRHEDRRQSPPATLKPIARAASTPATTSHS